MVMNLMVESAKKSPKNTNKTPRRVFGVFLPLRTLQVLEKTQGLFFRRCFSLFFLMSRRDESYTKGLGSLFFSDLKKFFRNFKNQTHVQQ